MGYLIKVPEILGLVQIKFNDKSFPRQKLKFY